MNTEKASYDARSEYFTKEEMADLFRPKKKKVRCSFCCVHPTVFLGIYLHM